ncbi:hypothetical protein [Methanobacterium sp.]|uniref:hypothetical protein n=1 Tax=Methanobacterium sp. TaxID=2164 RepID=UPI003C78908E
MFTKNMKIEEISKKNVKSFIYGLQKEGYVVKSSMGHYSSNFNKFGKYAPDIFAYKTSNDILIVEFETCSEIMSSKSEIKWRILCSKPGRNVHIVVPLCCKEKAIYKSRILNIPVNIHCLKDWKDSLEFNLQMSK